MKEDATDRSLLGRLYPITLAPPSFRKNKKGLVEFNVVYFRPIVSCLYILSRYPQFSPYYYTYQELRKNCAILDQTIKFFFFFFLNVISDCRLNDNDALRNSWEQP